MPAFGGFLKLAKPAKVPSFGARSGGEGSFASLGATSASVIPLAGSAASSVPDINLARSGAVSAARSRSIGHLNLSQPLGSSAARAEAVPSSNHATSRVLRISIHCDHYVGSLDHRGDLAARLDAQIVDRFVGDRGCHDLAVADIDADVCRRRTLLDLDNGAPDLVACTDAHDDPSKCSATPIRAGHVAAG